jgi:hypothetical protein
MLFKIPQNKTECIECIHNLQGKWSVHIRPPNRSLDANALWHATLAEMAKASGYTPDEMKAIIKTSITTSGILTMNEHKVTKTGMEYIQPRSSKDLTTDEFTLLINYTLDMQEAQLKQVREYANNIFN